MDHDWLMKPVPSCEYTHARRFARVRIDAGVWLLVLTPLSTAALLLYVAYRLPRASATGVSTGGDTSVRRRGRARLREGHHF